MNFGKYFRYYRTKAGLTQKEAAALIGVNDYQLGNYETNRSEPSLTILKKMSQTYRVSIDKMVNNNWLLKEKEAISEEGSPIDLDDLAQKLNKIAEQINEVNQKK